MLATLNQTLVKNKVIAVAVSGGSDSMALLHFMLSVKDTYGFSLVALNVEHGIRGELSLKDTEFVKEYCKNLGIKTLLYKVDAVKHAKENKLTLEQSARILRYECFFDAINSKKCDVVATAHHRGDNFESILFNLFRGTGLKGLTGISDMGGKIIRPFLDVSKYDIIKYVNENKIPYVTDQTNYDQTYTRNYVRSSIIPAITKRFTSAEDNVISLSKIAKLEDEFLDNLAKKELVLEDGKAKISLALHPCLFYRAVIMALKHVGIKKDWESAHLDRAFSLIDKQVGKKEDLLSGVIAVREYDGIVITPKTLLDNNEFDFGLGELNYFSTPLKIKKVSGEVDLKSGLFADLDKIGKGAKIRLKKDGDVFKNCNSKTKNLSDFFADKKVPLLDRNALPVLADKNEVLVIFGLAVSDKIKVDKSTKNIIQFTKE
jgi:tRNA(Ile)-lysidine synthase